MPFHGTGSAGKRKNKIHKHDKVEVRLYSPYVTLNDNKDRTKRVTTVMVDEITDSTDTDRRGLLIVGRSPARDIIDSTWSGLVLHQQSLENVARTLADPFGIQVQRMPKDLETGPVFSFEWECESPWQKLIAKADGLGYIFTSNEAGNLYLWKVGEGFRDEGFELAEGSGIRNLKIIENGAEQFHEYVARGAGEEAREIDSTCKNNRIMTVNLTDHVVSGDDLRRRALTELRRRRHTRIVAAVTGWGLGEARLRAWGDTFHKEITWNPNFIIPVKLPSIGFDGRLLISEVEYQADPSSMTTDITLVDPEAYA
jgi:prophage tail gpP-like protein